MFLFYEYRNVVRFVWVSYVFCRYYKSRQHSGSVWICIDLALLDSEPDAMKLIIVRYRNTFYADTGPQLFKNAYKRKIFSLNRYGIVR